MKKMFKALCSCLCLCAGFLALFWALSGLIPFRDLRQTRVWQDIYQNKNTVSYAFLGSSHVYCGVDPMRIAEQTGKKAILISSGQQTLTETYYCMEELLRYQSPEAVFVDLYGAYREFDEVNYTNLDCMRLSPSKIRLARSAFSETRLIDALFPLIREHSNWKNWDNIRQNIDNLHSAQPYEYGFSGIDTVVSDEQYAGYLAMEPDFAPVSLRETDRAMIRAMIALCRKHKVRPVFFLTPWLEEYTQKINYDSFLDAIRAETGSLFVLTAEQYHELGLSRETFIEDKVSDNQHLNLDGAARFTDFLIRNQL